MDVVTEKEWEYRALKARIEERKKDRKKKQEDRPTLMWETWEETYDKWLVKHFADDLDNQNELLCETVEPSSDMIVPLFRYQKEWLFWALKQEESSSKGGILADEMGMGKTIQAIALVLAKRELGKTISKSSLLSSSSSTNKQEPSAVKGTLILCPMVAVLQWVTEINRCTIEGSNKILVYHGSNRRKLSHDIEEYDFVITTYSTVEAEYRKFVMQPKQKCEWCGKAYYEEKLPIHQKSFCGPDGVKTAKQSKKQRKKLKLDEELLMQKTDSTESETYLQITDFMESETNVQEEGSTAETDMKKTGRRKYMKRSSMAEEGKNDGSMDNSSSVNQDLPQRKSILHSVKWDRIILDEAHYVKDRRCNTTKATLSLKSSYKWALSGTPIQNLVGELYSLVRFLQIVPYSFYFCKDCDCRTLDYSSTSECLQCPHKSVRHFCFWNRYIATPIKHEGSYGSGRDAMFLLKHKILKSILLRRSKKGRAADLALPLKIVTLRKDSLDVIEEDYYTSLYNKSQAQFNTYVKGGTVMNNYAHIFELLTRLRQAVDHPYLVVYSSTALAKMANSGNVEQPCGLCHDAVEDPAVTSCMHVFCKTCLIDFAASARQVPCPLCSELLTIDFTVNTDKVDQNSKQTLKGFRSSSILNRIQLDDFQSSTKIDALREEIRFMIERDGSAKGIVFSQFTSFLDLIHYSLQKSGINCVQLVGSMSIDARAAAVTKFTEDSDCRIFLMSLKAGSVALNLTVASQVFMMDPWWNPAVERQAQDRIHRIGQYKPVRIVRFVIENTVEEKILKLQEKKELVFEGTIGGSSEAFAKLTEADLKFLFTT
ncbi:DNA repair protein RAD16-like [Solanum pennellii]|uniref:DNA repair protein RAD16-like n=1 Tax=Solanum pennellii TaxID=28526 RepID=A0ABM1H807_SOLPN|nr:DNA repair protein RAD16-like [Solanum pennellii]